MVSVFSRLRSEWYAFYITPEEYEIAEKNGISKSTVESRVRTLCWDIEKAITQEVGIRKAVNYPKEAEENGVSYHVYRKRVRDGMSPKEAAVKPQVTRAERSAMMREIARNSNRVTKPETRRLAEKNGISISTLLLRIREQGMDEYTAATTPLMSNMESILIAQKASRKKYGDGFMGLSKRKC